jgi:curved DNA-binding protein CbpA
MVASRRGEDEGLYRRLNVPPGASPAQIRRAYRRLAQASHPDTHPDDADAPRRFLAITEAYEVLSDPQRRARYDRDRLRTASQQPSPVARPKPPRTAGPLCTVIFIEPTAPTGRTVIGAPTASPSGPTPLMIGPLHWRPDPAPPGRLPSSADMQSVLRAFPQLGWW